MAACQESATVQLLLPNDEHFLSQQESIWITGTWPIGKDFIIFFLLSSLPLSPSPSFPLLSLSHTPLLLYCALHWTWAHKPSQSNYVGNIHHWWGKQEEERKGSWPLRKSGLDFICCSDSCQGLISDSRIMSTGSLRVTSDSYRASLCHSALHCLTDCARAHVAAQLSIQAPVAPHPAGPAKWKAALITLASPHGGARE